MRLSLSLSILLLALLATPRADAALIIYAQEDGVNGGAITQIGSGPDFTSASFTGTYGDFSLTINGAASHNTADLSSLLGATVSIKNNAGDFRTINLYASQVNYSLPLGALLGVESGLSGTVNTGTLTGTGVFQAFLDANNQLLGNTFTNGPQSVVFDGSTFDTGSATGEFSRTGALYSITSQVTATISGGGEGNFSDHVNVTGVPEPLTAVLALTGFVPALALRWMRRRGVFGFVEPA